MSSRARRFGVTLAATGLIVAVGAWAGAHFLFGPTSPGQGEVIEIEPGTSFRQIAERLDDAGLVRSKFGFMVLAKLRGNAARLRAGEFMIPRGANAKTVLNLLVSGPALQRRITIPEGYNLRQIERVLVDRKVDSADVIHELLTDPDLPRELGVPAKSLEGYLFPDTYQFTKGYGARKMIEAMVRRFFDVYGEEFRRQERAVGLTTNQVVTLASIVEKETGAPQERGLIARVFLNRLAKGMPLQSDPTVIYAAGAAYTGTITKSQLAAANPYNTYVVKGLPPGPIASPGRASIKAVLWPAPTEDLYFVSRNDGTHVFSRTYDEHLRYVKQFQRSAGATTSASAPK